MFCYPGLVPICNIHFGVFVIKNFICPESCSFLGQMNPYSSKLSGYNFCNTHFNYSTILNQVIRVHNVQRHCHVKALLIIIDP